MNKKKYAKLLLVAVTGASLLAFPDSAKAELAGLANKEIICKRINKENPPPEQPERLKLHSCQTLQYPLAPLAPAIQPDPIPPYTS